MEHLEITKELKDKLRQSITLSRVVEHLVEPVDGRGPVTFPIHLENFCKEMDSIISLVGSDMKDTTKLLERCHDKMQYDRGLLNKNTYWVDLMYDVVQHLKKLQVI